MAFEFLSLPVTIPWRLIAVSPDMMDVRFGNKQFPFRWRTSLSLYAYEPRPEDLPAEICDQITYLKVSATITGFQPELDEIRFVEMIHTWYPDTPTEELEDFEAIMREYWACYGTQLQVSVFPQPYTPLVGDDQFPTDFSSYPHIVDFQPKTRDLYQTATEAGEILTASHSGIKTDKTHATTETSETGIEGGIGVQIGPVNVGGKATHKWGETSQDSRSIQAEASRERREGHGTTTNLSQMYNILTGYHPGTNRVVFFMLPRPHVLQPTDRRTFVNGLRYIEGVQDFFLVVARPRGVEGLCVEALLETGHFSEYVQVLEHAPSHESGSETFHFQAFGDGADFEQQFNIESGWLIDRSQGDEGHPGIAFTTAADSSTPRLLNYFPVSDTTIQVDGQLGSAGGRATSLLKGSFTVFKRKDQPFPSNSGSMADISDLLITARSLRACLRRGETCVEPVPVPEPPVLDIGPPPEPPMDIDIGDWWVTGEEKIDIPAILIREDIAVQTRLPAMKELLRQIHFRMASNPRSISRYPMGEVRFFDSNYFMGRFRRLLPKALKGVLLKDVRGLPPRVLQTLGPQTSVDHTLGMKLHEFTRRTGLAVKEAVHARRQILAFLAQRNLPPKRSNPTCGRRGWAEVYWRGKSAILPPLLI